MKPAPDLVGHRYFHVVESKVWIHDEAAESEYSTHFLGMLDGHACWGVDVPRKIRLMVERLICSVCLGEHPKTIG